ncbi:MAG: hypothetical protein NT061_06750 [Spirochaetes bacterium]|nr:hypothetical protein [Spirochaetota bacterium]
MQVNFSLIHGYDSSNTHWFVVFNSAYDKDSILGIPEFKSKQITLESHPMAALTPDQKLVGIDANKAFHTVKTHGYYIAGSKIEVTGM